jgi:hypothetical protein
MFYNELLFKNVPHFFLLLNLNYQLTSELLILTVVSSMTSHLTHPDTPSPSQRDIILSQLRLSAEKIEAYDSTWDEEWRSFNEKFNTNLSLEIFLEVALKLIKNEVWCGALEIEIKDLGRCNWESCWCEECESRIPVVEISCQG